MAAALHLWIKLVRWKDESMLLCADSGRSLRW
jgi:hypothetical protein